MGPDGTTPHSWRVALLPYFEAPQLQALYTQYKFDEPWDSENNLKIVTAGARRSASPAGQPDDCGYFMAIGPGAIFDTNGTQTNVRNITDGTSHDHRYRRGQTGNPLDQARGDRLQPAQPMPALGGFFTGGFNTLFADGSVHFLPGDIDNEVLRALLSKSGEEIVQMDAAGTFQGE